MSDNNEMRRPPAYVSVNEAAEILSCSPCTIYRALRQGFLPHKRIGAGFGAGARGAYRILISDLARAFEPEARAGFEHPEPETTIPTRGMTKNPNRPPTGNPPGNPAGRRPRTDK